MKKVLLVVAVTALASQSVAQESFHARLSKGEIIVEASKVAGSDIPETKVTAVIDAPPGEIWKLVEQCNNYPKNMIRIKKAKELSRSGNQVKCQVTAEIPWPFSDLTAITMAKHTVGPPVWKREWDLVEGDYKSNKGSWRIQSFDLENTRSLVVYQVHAVPNMSVPDSLVKKAQRETMPDLIKHVRKRVATK